MLTAFSLIHSGAAPATGRSLISTPRALATAAQTERMRLMSTQEPMCSTGGIPSAWQTPFNPSPASSAGASAAAVTNLLPFNLFGNLGTLEAGWTAAFAALGIPVQTAAASGLAAHLWGLIFAAFFGVVGWAALSFTGGRS